MLKSYCEGQPVAYSILKNAIINGRVAHAYLFSAANINDAFDIAVSFAKSLLCPENKYEGGDCSGCSICHRISNGNYTELKIIEPEGLWIKKNQLLELQEEFKMTSLEGDKKIYIINHADKLNAQSANSILKFLEEPESNIIALLTTSDINNVLETIVSRCQTVTLKNNNNGVINKDFADVANKTIIKIGQLYYKNEEELYNFVIDAKNVEKLDAIVRFIKRYEVFKIEVLLEIKKLWYDYFCSKEDFIWAFDILTLFYKDVLNYKYNLALQFFDYYRDIVEFVAQNNDCNDIIHKMQIIILQKEKIKYNINLNLLMDKLILEMEKEV